MILPDWHQSPRRRLRRGNIQAGIPGNRPKLWLPVGLAVELGGEKINLIRTDPENSFLRVMSPSSAISTEMRTADCAVRLPSRVCSIHSLPFQW